MSRHLSASTLQELLDEELHGEDYQAVSNHLQDCMQCRMALASMQSLVQDLKGLPSRATGKVPPRWVPPVPLRAPGLARAWAFAAVVAVLMFAIGFFAGTRAGWQLSPPGIEPSRHEREPLSEAIQHRGTQYVNAIADWRRMEASKPAASEGREAALSSLYGAAFELQRLMPEDAQIGQVLRTIGDLRDRAALSTGRQGQEK